MLHPDEGLIHAWLDGELDADEAARVEALVRDDPAWAAAAAEARGLIAASARIAGMLDDVPARVIPAPVATSAPARPVVRRAMPWWTARVAALLVVAVGVSVVMRRTPAEPMVTPQLDVTAAPAPQRAEAVAAAPSPKAPSPAAAPTTPSAAPTPAAPPPAVSSAGALAGAAALADQRATLRRDLEERAAVVRDLSNSAAVGTAAAEAKKESRALGALKSAADAAPREECYAEAPKTVGLAPVMYRVRRIDDSTATGAVSRERELGAQARTVAPRAAAPAAVPSLAMRVRGDTLFLARATGAAGMALRVACPIP
jgi:hypothetical protein